MLALSIHQRALSYTDDTDDTDEERARDEGRDQCCGARIIFLFLGYFPINKVIINEVIGI